MQRYEYKVVPAPQKGTKAKGVKTPEGRFATSIEQLLNQMGQDGWEYQRAELLPSEERSGLTGSTTNWRNVLVFRRALAAGEAPQPTPPEEDSAPTPRPVPGPQDVLSAPPAAPAPISEQPQDPPLSLKPSDEVADEPSR
ncbi:protein of unknown function [Ruegeria halocynthiae]|uniref:DUF4177 domain-containing protein n=1 Tax=Ruegeria halocynthiae TaxID=985054 RepID=A0A1H2REV2_9RHOB|nr:DUF4177 domain-containing protein [Ruegeria halocynthiae]SDW17996.1 protein of unknown function [Ruegeria halocynthiae]